MYVVWLPVFPCYVGRIILHVFHQHYLTSNLSMTLKVVRSLRRASVIICPDTHVFVQERLGV